MLPQHNNKSIENACYLTTIEVCKAKGLSDLQGYDITLVYVMQLTNKDLTTIEVCKTKGLSDLQGCNITLCVHNVVKKERKKERKKE